MYRRPFSLLLPDGKQEYRTFIGVILSLITISILLPYLIWKTQVIIGQEDFKVYTKELQNYYTMKDEFGMGQKFMIAAGISAYDGSSEDEEDLSVGKLRFILKQWGTDDLEGTGGFRYIELRSRKCSEEDFNLPDGSNSNSQFYQLEDEFETDLLIYSPKMRCIVDEDIN